MTETPAPEKHDFALIIGAMKSGTTSLFRILSQHPAVCPSREKEPEFFSDDSNYAKGLQWYLDLWDWDPECHRVCLEASTGYTKFPQRPNVPERIARLKDRNFRFVYVVRNPFERIESHVRHGLYAGWTGSLDEGLRSKDGVIDITRYAAQLDEYLKLFPRDSILLLTFDEFTRDPETVLRKICRHIGIDENFEFTGLKFKSNAGERYEVPKFVNELGESRNPVARLFKAALGFVSRRSVKYQFWRYSPMKVNRGRYRLNDREREEIFRILKPDLDRLEAEYGVDSTRNWQPRG